LNYDLIDCVDVNTW